MQYQITLFDKSGEYRPVSAIVESEPVDLSDMNEKKKLLAKGTQKICFARRWTKNDLVRFGYLTAKIREYDKEKIAAENKARYEKIKEEKFSSGEWKRPKGDK